MILTHGRSLFLFLQLIQLIQTSYAQTSKLFQWQFANNAISTSLPTCQNFPIIVKSFQNDNSTHGTPPYYMMALAVSGVPVLSSIGSDENSLNWQVTHPAGTQLMLSVVDANGSAGGIPPLLYTVVTGQSTTCIPTTRTSSFTVTSNVTNTLTTCQPWGITIKDGVAPYTVTLAALGSPVVTNVTLGPQDDAFTYIDRADPNGQLLAAVSDLTGAYANGTPLVKTIGSSNVSCIGLVSSSGNSTIIQQQEKAASDSAAKNRKRKDIIVGVCAAIGGIIILAIALFIFSYWRKRQRRQRVEFGEIDPMPITYQDDPGQMLSLITPTPYTIHSTKPTPPVSDFSTSALSPHSYEAGEYDPYHHSTDSQTGASSSSPQFTSTTANAPSGRRYNKAAEAKMYSNRPVSAGSNAHSTSTVSHQARMPDVPHRTTALQAEATQEQDEIIVQHRDGGVVRELPPPYADRGQIGNHS